jgi:hypothetical protein
MSCRHLFVWLKAAHSAPALTALEWEDRRIEAFTNRGSFIGEPSHETDSAWDKLIHGEAAEIVIKFVSSAHIGIGMKIRLLPYEMERIDLTSLALNDGSRYFGGMAVFHDLHCLVRLCFALASMDSHVLAEAVAPLGLQGLLPHPLEKSQQG